MSTVGAGDVAEEEDGNVPPVVEELVDGDMPPGALAGLVLLGGVAVVVTEGEEGRGDPAPEADGVGEGVHGIFVVVVVVVTVVNVVPERDSPMVGACVVVAAMVGIFMLGGRAPVPAGGAAVVGWRVPTMVGRGVAPPGCRLVVVGVTVLLAVGR